ncbi:hypothetical protein ACLKA6_019760 [Drosophila palustris]
MPTIKLQSSDEEIFDIDVEIVKCSGTIRPMLEGDDETAIWPLLNVNSSILRMVLAWANYHKDDPQPTADEDNENKEKRTNEITLWDADFLKVDQSTLFELMMAANYLEIEGLLDLTITTVADMIRGKTTEEIRETFNMENDFTPEQLEQVRRENEWCEEKEK